METPVSSQESNSRTSVVQYLACDQAGHVFNHCDICVVTQLDRPRETQPNQIDYDIWKFAEAICCRHPSFLFHLCHGHWILVDQDVYHYQTQNGFTSAEFRRPPMTRVYHRRHQQFHHLTRIFLLLIMFPHVSYVVVLYQLGYFSVVSGPVTVSPFMYKLQV